ncbi:MAG: hypothetical protein ACPKPY_09545, partial [Nitrososphaeraceae archaeon]
MSKTDHTSLKDKPQIFGEESKEKWKQKYEPTHINEEHDYAKFEEFNGIDSLQIDITLPHTYFEAVQEISKKIEMPLREWINIAVLEQIDLLVKDKNKLGSIVTDTFIMKYRIGMLTADMRKSIIQDRHYYMDEFVISK